MSAVSGILVSASIGGERAVLQQKIQSRDALLLPGRNRAIFVEAVESVWSHNVVLFSQHICA